MVRRYTERRHSMRLSVYRYILLLGYALRANPTYAQNHRVMTNYSHPPKASYGVAPLRRTTTYCLQRRALSETFGGWLYYRSGGYGLRPNRPYGFCPAGEGIFQM